MSKILRTNAEQHLSQFPQATIAFHSSDELLHELQVHQIELEMQNEELRLAQVALEESRDRYLDLYELAPIGYLTLSCEGRIAELNLTGATLLGIGRNKLINQRFASYILPEDNDSWHHHFLNVLKYDRMQSCELALKRGDGSVFHAGLDCRRSKMGNAFSIRIALADITERKQADKARYHEMEQQQMHVVAQAASAIAHDINEPLSAIAAYSRAALMMLKAKNPDYNEICNAIERIEQQTLRTGLSVCDLLNSFGQ